MNEHLERLLRAHPDDGYLHYHAARYEVLLRLMETHGSGVHRVLDIGRSRFSGLARQVVNCPVDTLGFEPDGETDTGFNYQFDLNDSADRNRWRVDLPRYGIIVFAEVIEHLYTSPAQVLAFLRSLLTDEGIIIIQTPNAVVAHKRIQMLMGRNPYSLISENRGNPAHYREYTARELEAYCRSVGLRVDQLSFENYFDYRYTDHQDGAFSKKGRNRIFNIIYSLLPRSLRPGLTVVAARADDGARDE